MARLESNFSCESHELKQKTIFLEYNNKLKIKSGTIQCYLKEPDKRVYIDRQPSLSPSCKCISAPRESATNDMAEAERRRRQISC